MAYMMWDGRFSKQIDVSVNELNSSIAFDKRMYRHDIQGSIAHVTMLGDCHIISKADSLKIINGLKDILNDIDSGTLKFDPSAEDIHMFVETELTKRLGDIGKRLHTSRSRNDQIAVDLRLYLRDEITKIEDMVRNLIEKIIEIAENNTETVMPGYTHLQRAQPITFAHHLMAYVWMFLRDIDRFKDAKKRMNVCPLGSGALAGTTYKINRYQTAEFLGFEYPMENSIDGVSDRDYCIELNSAMSLLMIHLSRFSEEIIMWCSWEFKFIELDDSFATGSSIMPQKKNPDVPELIRGKTGRVNGNLVTLLTMMKGLPLAYNKDMQEDKEAIFDSLDNVKLCINTFTPMLTTMRVLRENMRNAAARGFINATDCADYLVKKGMPFRDAYKITSTLIVKCIEKGMTLEDLPLVEYQKVNNLFTDDVYKAISLDTCIKERKSYGGTSPNSVLQQFIEAKKKLIEIVQQ